jgi:hypothetical protein
MIAVEESVAGVNGMTTESLFGMCTLLVTMLGIFLACFDDSDHKGGGGSPISHLGDAATAADALFSDGVGLGVLEPLWRISTPDGMLWTLSRGWSPRDQANALGLAGLLAAIGSIFAAVSSGIAALVCGSWRLCRRRKLKEDAEPESDLPPHKGLTMSSFVTMLAYWGYLRMYVMGLLREYILRAAASLKDEDALRYMSRDKWVVGWQDFYLTHMYGVIVDCFHRPISSAPDATVDVIKRTRPGGVFWGPLHSYKPTNEAQKCVNLASYNYLGFGGVDEVCTPAAEAAFLEHGFCSGGTRTEGEHSHFIANSNKKWRSISTRRMPLC